MLHPEETKQIFQNGKSTLLCYGFLATGSLNTDGFSLNKICVGVMCVGRNRKNITIQLNRRIDELLRIGEKKVKVDGRAEGIHSVKTADSYRGTAGRLLSTGLKSRVKSPSILCNVNQGDTAVSVSQGARWMA